MIDLARTQDDLLYQILSNHPRVRQVERADVEGIEFHQGPWVRSVTAGDLRPEVKGLVELMDNNPLVCADRASVPDPVSTLALIALGPVFLAGLVTEAPTMIVNASADEAQVEGFLATAGWAEGLTLHSEYDSGAKVLGATAIASIHTPSDWSDIDDLYEERYGHSFFVRQDDESDWAPALVEGKPYALFRLRYTPGDDTSLLTIQVLADRLGKCGPRQLVHMLNVMSGFEESLGIA